MPYSESEQMSQELYSEVSAVQESSLTKEVTSLFPQSCKEGDPHSKEPLVEELQQEPYRRLLLSMSTLVQVTTRHNCIEVALVL